MYRVECDLPYVTVLWHEWLRVSFEHHDMGRAVGNLPCCPTPELTWGGLLRWEGCKGLCIGEFALLGGDGLLGNSATLP